MANKYTFSALEVSESKWRSLSIRLAEGSAKEHFRKVWGKQCQAVTGHFEVTSGKAPDWAKWKPHEWSEKNVEDRESFVAWEGVTVAGLLNLRKSFPSQSLADEQVTYVEHLATSPGNCRTPIWERRLAQVGKALFAFSILRSVESGHAGRVGLHATEESQGFYSRLNEQFGMFLPARRGIDGFHRGESALNYFETNADSALKFLGDYLDD